MKTNNEKLDKIAHTSALVLLFFPSSLPAFLTAVRFSATSFLFNVSVGVQCWIYAYRCITEHLPRGTYTARMRLSLYSSATGVDRCACPRIRRGANVAGVQVKQLFI